MGFFTYFKNFFYSVGQIIRWALLFLYFQLPILAFTLLFGTLTGNTFSHIILTVIFLVFPLGFPVLIFWNLGVLGMISSGVFIDDLLLKIIKYTPPLGTIVRQSQGNYLPYILASIVVIIISKILFDKNRVERNGEILEFEKN